MSGLEVTDAVAATHTGMVRRSNEDASLVEPPLFAVADGMGGARAGEVASALAIETLHGGLTAGLAPEEALRDALERANGRIHERTRGDVAVAGMGTTATAALADDGRIAFAHVGDSRAYLFRDGALQQLSDDHSLVGELVRRGALTQEEADRHPQRAVITRALGTEPSVVVDTWSIEAQAGDVVLLCSDGLTGMVRDREILEALRVQPVLEVVARDLIRLANARGGEDNITCVLFRVGEPAPGSAAQDGPAHAGGYTILRFDEPKRSRSWSGPVAFLATAAVLVALVLGGAWLMTWSHFVGSDADGRVTLYQGLPVDFGSGVGLYRAVEVTTIPTALLSQAERKRLFDQTPSSEADARARLAHAAQTVPWADQLPAGP